MNLPGEPASPDLLERAGWLLLGVLSLTIVLLAVFRPTDPGAILDDIRLAAGFDRYQAALNEGHRLHRTAVAELRMSREDGEEGSRQRAYRHFGEAVRHFDVARGEAEGFHEDQRAQTAMAKTYYAWATELHREGTGAWYRRNDEETLRRARSVVDRALALPNIPGSDRNDLEELGTRIDRALTPWPIL